MIIRINILTVLVIITSYVGDPYQPSSIWWETGNHRKLFCLCNFPSPESCNTEVKLQELQREAQASTGLGEELLRCHFCFHKDLDTQESKKKKIYHDLSCFCLLTQTLHFRECFFGEIWTDWTSSAQAPCFTWKHDCFRVWVKIGYFKIIWNWMVSRSWSVVWSRCFPYELRSK